MITGYHQLKGKYDVRLRSSLTTAEGLELGSLFSDRVCGATHRIATYRIAGYNSRVSERKRYRNWNATNAISRLLPLPGAP
jgi:hypothetical protein